MSCGGTWLTKITKLKKANGCGSTKNWTKHVSSTKAKLNGIVWECRKSSKKSSTTFANATLDKNGNRWVLGRPIEVVAATKIQTSFRAFQARKKLRQLKGLQRLKKIMQADGCCTTVQTLSALNQFQTYSKIQDQIQARRLCMVIQGRLRKKKLKNQLQVDAKLHQAETVWSSTPKSKDDIKTKIHSREEAAIKRERAMSYAFNHQWRANASQKQLMGNTILGNVEWSWSWMDRWISARPWESPFVVTANAESRSTTTTPTFKIGKTKSKITSTSGTSSGKSSRTLSNGKRVIKSQRRSSSFSPSSKGHVKKVGSGLKNPASN